ERLTAFCSLYNITPWDFQSEVEWGNYANSRPSGIPDIDHVAWRVVYDWLRERSGVDLTDFETDYEHEKAVLVRLYTEAGINLVWEDGPPDDDDLVLSTGRSQGKAVIINPIFAKDPTPEPAPVEPPDVLEGGECFVMFESFRIISAEPPNHLHQWILISQPDPRVMPGDDHPAIAQFPVGVVAEWLGRRLARQMAGLRSPQSRGIVQAIQSPSDIIQLASSHMDPMYSFEAIQDTFFGSLRPTVCLYWQGGWFECLEAFMATSASRLRTGVVQPNAPEPIAAELTAGDPVAAMRRMTGGVWVRVLRVDIASRSVWVIRALPGPAALATLQGEEVLRRRGANIGLLEADELEEVRERVNWWLPTIQRFWREF
ncbi:MAG TPA: hypothetical protein VH092_00660, partial [Urbifossiella sp.]|nr:hypothetical protein [Urbifossiella sp.]